MLQLLFLQSYTLIAKIHTDSEVVVSKTLLFDKMLSLGRYFIKCHELRNFTIISMRN